MKKKKSKKIFKFILLELIFCSLCVPILAFHGPFKNIKNTLVGMSMTTMSHQWIAKLFLSDEEINKVLNENSVETIAQSKENINNINIKSDGENSVKLSVSEGTGFKAYLLEISNPKKVKVGYAKDFKKCGQPTSEIAKRFNAIAAINGGSFTDKVASGIYAGNGRSPIGIIMSEGKIIYKTVGYNSDLDIVGITKKGVLIVGKYTINQLKDLDCSEAVCFSPVLIVGGKKVKINGNGGGGSFPRTAIGQREDGTILLLVVDGTIIKRYGVYENELQDILYDAGATTAVSLDGGSSTTMYYKDNVVNTPCDSVGERPVPSIFYVES